MYHNPPPENDPHQARSTARNPASQQPPQPPPPQFYSIPLTIHSTPATYVGQPPPIPPPLAPTLQEQEASSRPPITHIRAPTVPQHAQNPGIIPTPPPPQPPPAQPGPQISPSAQDLSSQWPTNEASPSSPVNIMSPPPQPFAIQTPVTQPTPKQPQPQIQPPPQGSVGRQALRGVPTFLNKLYNMIWDTACNDLIHWSDAGQSFIVTRHEAFAREVLPRFFKHNNFSSFVRQLNMYGFKKVPHITTGSYETDMRGEPWEFISPQFQRDRPDLMIGMTRKGDRHGSRKVKQEDMKRERLHDFGTTLLEPPLFPRTSDSEDIHLDESMDIDQMRRSIIRMNSTQIAIMRDLQSLQRDNRLLYQELMLAREDRRSQQETIDKILNFLSSLYSGDDVPRKRRLLPVAGDSTTGSGRGARHDNEVPTVRRVDSTSSHSAASSPHQLNISAASSNTNPGTLSGSPPPGTAPEGQKNMDMDLIGMNCTTGNADILIPNGATTTAASTGQVFNIDDLLGAIKTSRATSKVSSTTSGGSKGHNTSLDIKPTISVDSPDMMTDSDYASAKRAPPPQTLSGNVETYLTLELPQVGSVTPSASPTTTTANQIDSMLKGVWK